jgi:hypothetical protein
MAIAAFCTFEVSKVILLHARNKVASLKIINKCKIKLIAQEL